MHIEIAIFVLAVLPLLIFLRAPVGLAMFVCGFFGTYFLLGDFYIPLNRLKTETYTLFSNYSFSIIPLFLLMGQFATIAKLSTRLFNTASSWLGHKKGGLAIAAIGACAGFGAICGSSLATAATMGKTALPELQKHKYESGFAQATLAAGGTLGILIPPSIVLVVYAILTEQNIAKLFLAAIVPGVLAAIFYMLAILLYVKLYPQAATRQPKQSLQTRIYSLANITPVLFVFLIVIGGIYGGIFSPTEAACVGAVLVFFMAIKSGNMNWQNFTQAIFDVAKTTAMIFFILLGATMLNGFLALSQLPQFITNIFAEQNLSPYIILICILLFYLLFGCIMDSLSMILLTIPIFFPIIVGLDFGMQPEQVAIWFGILALIAVEVGLITPPVGMNLFIIKSLADNKDKIPITKTYKAIMFFVTADVIRLLILITLPAISLFLI